MTRSLWRIERFASEIPGPAVVLTTPWAPSTNHYWMTRVVGKRAMVFLGKAGKRFRADVMAAWLAEPRERLTGRLAVEYLLWMPDRRVRDCDNVLKALNDALQHAGVIENDSQFDRILVVRAGVDPPGRVEIRISQLDT